MQTMNRIEPLPIAPDLPVDPPDAYTEAMVRRAGTSFFWGMRRLPLARRRGVFAVYAFCREVDDIADGDLAIDRKVALLNAWRAEIALLFKGAGHHPIAQALKAPVAAFGLRQEDFIAVIAGMEMDAHPRVRIADMDELHLYCDRVACAVGRLCVRVFGLDDDAGVRLADAMGHALQLTNILRDVREDADRDRVYLPADKLADAGAGGTGIEDILAAPGLADLCEDLAARAERYFTEADAIIAEADPRTVRPALMMMQIYRRILVKLQKRGWHDMRRNVGASKLEKVAIAIRYGLFG